jgi:hypothetical protein
LFNFSIQIEKGSERRRDSRQEVKGLWIGLGQGKVNRGLEARNTEELKSMRSCSLLDDREGSRGGMKDDTKI